MTQINDQKIDMRHASREELRILAASILGLKNYFRSQDCKICIRIKKPIKHSSPSPSSTAPPKKALSK